MKYINLIFFVLLFTSIYSCDRQKEDPPAIAPNVTVYITKASDVPIYQEYVGETLGYEDIDIAARTEGFLEEVHFDEGTQVSQGQLLYSIESQQYQANVAEKMSNLAAQQTLLANAKSDLGRYEPLVKENAISEIEYDSAKTRYEASLSSVDAAQASLEAAEIQLGYTKIYSPINGIIGKTKAKVGDLVGNSPTNSVLNTVSALDPILVQFFITETQYLYFARKYIKNTNHRKDRKDDFRLILSDGSTYEYRGQADFIDRSVDTETGAILIQASFPNPKGLLRPGQFARIVAEIELVKDGILIPQRCVSELQGIFNVLVVDEKNIVQNRQVKTGPKVGSFWLIRSGLKPGERVIYEGLQIVREGVTVKPEVKEVPLPDPQEY